MEREIDLSRVIRHIPPSSLSYQDWINVGMALKLEGYPCSLWDDWSRDDSRYKDGDCAKKWETFGGSSEPVTAGTIIQLAKDYGYNPALDVTLLDWDDVIGVDKYDTGWIEPEHIEKSVNDYESKAIDEIVTYISTLFEPEDKVGYVMRSFKDEDGKYKPGDRGTSSRTADQLIKELEKYKKKYKGDYKKTIDEALGSYDPEGGAWIRFNPLDGNGVRNENVASYKYALVESDTLEIDKQLGVIKELQIPAAIVVHSGGKSLHAIVRIDAPTYPIYKARVEMLYKVCDSYGLRVDKQNKNPSRLSRMPGIRRKSEWQRIIATNIGKSSWKDWEEYQKEQEDELPDPEDLFSPENESIELKPEVISGILRQGRKMILSSASKAGKSFLLIELGMALATGTEWLGHECRESRVLYINFEISKDSFIDRLRHVAKARNTKMADYRGMFDCLNLRGYTKQFRELLPGIKHKIRKNEYDVVIIDPIYKTILGDENDAKVVAEFCNALDNLATETETTVIFCHHHSKAAGEGMAAQNRSSGSGVFARDPDAIVDLLQISPVDRDGTPLEITEVIGADKDVITENTFFLRMETSLREFKPIDPLEIAFCYPVHFVVKGLENARGGGTENRSRREKQEAGRQTQASRKQKNIDKMLDFISLNGEPPTIQEIKDYFGDGVSERTIRNWIKEAGDDVTIKNGLVFLRN